MKNYSLILLIVTIFLSACATTKQKSKNNDSSTIVSPSKSSPYTIAYSSNGIVLTDNEGKSKNRIITRGGYAAWSPDGKRFAYYAKYEERKTWSIHTMNCDGTNRKRLTHVKNKWDNSPAWSPDGTKIAFSREYEDSEKNWQQEVWIMNADGSQQTQIKPIKGGGPYFTPDGRIVFHSAFKDQETKISIADIDGNNIIQLTHNEAEEQHPEVSPNGKQIAFMSDRDGNKEIYVMNIDGSNQKRLTSSEAAKWYPSWSPDGSKIIFSSTSLDGERNIYMMNKDGSSLKKIISNGTQPAWSKIFPVLEEPYFGQKPPGLIPELFAPGIVSTKEHLETEVLFLPDMTELSFTRSGGEYKEPKWFVMQYKKNKWSKKSIPSTEINQYKEQFSPALSEMKRHEIFKDIPITGFTVSAKGTYYFYFIDFNDGGSGHMSYSRLIDGKYETPQKLSKAINTGKYIAHPFIAPDESYLMWDAEIEGENTPDIYISFRQKDGSWGEAINMGDQINSALYEQRPKVTPDGKYLFFWKGDVKVRADGSRYVIGSPHWVDAQIIEELRLQE